MSRLLSLRCVCLLLVLPVWAPCLAPIARADELDIGREDQLKAAYLFNFVKFVEWPANDGAPIRICFIGGQGIHASLSASSAGKRVGARSISTSALKVADSRSGCDVIYVDAAVNASSLVQDEALTVSEADDFTREGGVIRLFKHDNRLKFDINLDNARRAGLKISSNLLKLASRVEQEATP